MMNVSRIVALGSSIYRILRVSEVPGSSRSYGPPPRCETGWVPFKTLLARLRGSEILETQSDECLEDRVPGRLNLLCFTSLGGSWERQIPGT